MAERCLLEKSPRMSTRPAGHEAEAEATMYEAEARHVREQLSVYEHED